MNGRRRAIALTCALLALGMASPDLHGQDGYELGGLAGSATRMGFGARGMAFGNALGAVTSNQGLSYYNPAVVPFQTERTALVSVGFLPFDRNLNFASYTQALKPSGGFSLALINAGVSKIEGRNSDGLRTEVYSTSENVFLFSFGIKVQSELAIGISAKIFYYSLFQGVKSTTVGFDVGMLYSMNDEWTFGLIINDINSKYRWDTSQLYGREGNTTVDRFPLRQRLAASYAPSFLHCTLAGELERIGRTWLTRVGAEFPLHELFRLRGGIDQIAFDRSISSKPSMGLSFAIPNVPWKPLLSYGYIVEPYGTGGIHMLSLTASFE